jgi:hypothetical protein
MMQYYDFSRLIRKYQTTFTTITITDGYYDDYGDWVKGSEVRKELQGAIISHRESKIYRSEGNLTAKDKRLFMLEPIENALLHSKVIHNGNEYSIEDNVENAIFTGVYAYRLKYVSAFDEKGGAQDD